MNYLNCLIEQLCPQGVEYRPLEQCCYILDKKRKPVTKAAREAGEYPYYGANGVQDYVSDYIFDGTFVLVGEDGSVVTPTGTPVVTWATGKIWVNNHAHIIEEKDGVLLRFLFHFLQTVNVSPLIHGNIPKLTGGDFRGIRIPLPPLPVQEEIVRILDSFTELMAELTTELTARRKQYEHYRDELLTIEDGVECKLIGDVCALSAGGDVPKEKFSKEKTDEYSVPIYSNGIGENALYGFTNIAKIQAPCVTVAARGTIGYCELRNENFFPVVRLICAKPKENILPAYLKYFIETIKFQVPKSGIPQLTVPMLAKYQIPVLQLEEQERIIRLLSKFDTLCNDLTSGLPAEIAARQKQYEYYRDKLLTFSDLDDKLR